MNNSNDFYVIGLMSGTSLDGLDLCYVHFKQESQWNFEIIYATTLSYSSQWFKKLSHAHLHSVSYVNQLNYEYSLYLNKQIHEFIATYSIKKIDLIASHGHTVWHQPQENFTKQIGDHQVIASNLKVPVVVDFRSQDVALGGQGAPLVPFGDHYLFSEYDACLNFGGFANVSMLKNQQRIAFDVCPFNKVLNFYAQKLGKPFDDAGKIASSHQVNQDLLQKLNEIEFYQKSGPKSLGVEFLEQYIFPLIEAYHLSEGEKIATFSKHISQQVSKVVTGYKQVLVTGGGAYNDFIVSEIQKITNTYLVIPNEKLIDFKEAMVFALLGLMKYLGKNNVISSVTGAQKNHSSGKIIKPS